MRRPRPSGFLHSELVFFVHAGVRPTEAPGRLISSPWPEKIEIATVWKVGQAFVVDGEVIYLTSEEVAEGGEAFREKISVALEKRGPKLLIADYDLVPVSE